MWTDPEFDVVRATRSIRNVKAGESIMALPLSYVHPGSTCVVREKSVLSIDHFDVLQGGIGDCWLLSAMSSVAFSTDRIDEIIVYTDDIFGITVFKLLGHFICVDHNVPVLIRHDGTSEIIAPNVSKQNETWPLLLEKCILKIMASQICPFEIYDFNLRRRMSRGILHGGPDYQDINGGFPRWALSILLGARFEPIQTRFVTDLVGALECREGEALVGCACTSAEKSDSYIDEGFVYGHAYSIIRVDKEKKLIRVRNPWGEVESTKWDDSGELNGTNWEDDGEFFVDVQDFKERFPIICFAKIRKTHFVLR